MKKTAITIVKRLDEDQIEALICFMSGEFPEQAVPEVLKKMKSLKKQNKTPDAPPPVLPQPPDPQECDGEDDDEKSWIQPDEGAEKPEGVL